MKRIRLFEIILGMLLISGCNQAPSAPPPSATELQAAPTMTPSTATSEAPVPAGWAAHTSQQCEYVISYPPEIQVSDQNPYSQIFEVKLANPEEGTRNFIYVSVIPPAIQGMVKAGIYNNEVYNFDPVEAEILLNLPVGGSKPVREAPNVESGFTYERKPDTQIGGYLAKSYENIRPWEFPVGTKEIRYYLPVDDCIYLIGGYLDTTESKQPGVISEERFNQIIATVRLIP